MKKQSRRALLVIAAAFGVFVGSAAESVITKYFDAGRAAQWDRVEWGAVTPENATVTVRVRAADSKSDFSTGNATQWCGPINGVQGVNNVPFTPCPFLNGHRWLQLDVRLNTTMDNVRPTVSDVKVFWSY